MSEVANVVAKSAQPAVKTTAVLAASGGLVASFALPAQAAPSEQKSSQRTQAASAVPVAVKAPAAAAPAATTAFGVIGFTATAKPKPKPVVVEVPEEPQPTRSESAASRSTERQPVATTRKPATGGVLDIAASLVGIPYVYGGTTPAGFDCSGFTQYVFRQVGISLPRTSQAQMAATTPVSNPQPGDLVFLGPGHVGIYAGNGMMYDSPRTGKSTSLRAVYSSSATYGRV